MSTPREKPLIAIDIEIPIGQSDGVAYYRVPPHFKDFLLKCEEEHDIVGFEWDGTLNFGVILKKKL